MAAYLKKLIFTYKQDLQITYS